MTDVVIAGACRTAIGRFQGSLAGFTAPELGSHVLKEALSRSGVAAEKVDEVILGNVLQAGVGQAPARQAQRAAGIPDAVPALTVNKVCGSGLKAVMLAAQAIRCGDAKVILAGGMESMTRAPYMVPKARDGMRLGHASIVDSMIADGLWDPYYDMHMGMTGEAVCSEYSISRDQQDDWSARSHARASAAHKEGRFAEEIAPIEIAPRKGDPWSFDKDEGVRDDVTAEDLNKLRPAFDKEGSVTAGNASQISDGAAAVVVLAEDVAKDMGIEPLARITGYAAGGMDPKWVMMAPTEAAKNLQEKTGVAPRDYDLVELNEAFSSQCCAISSLWEMDEEKMNVNGGGVALGHPIGASGTRVLVTLIHALRQRDLHHGMATLCLGGGNAVAMAVEVC